MESPNFRNIVISTRKYPEIKKKYGIHTVERDSCKKFINNYFSDAAQKSYELTDKNKLELSIIEGEAKKIIIFPCVDKNRNEETEETTKEEIYVNELLNLLDDSVSKTNTLFILHKSDLLLDSNYTENFLNEEALKKMNLINYNFIVFQHDDANSPNIYKKVIIDKLQQGKGFKDVYDEIIKAYKLLRKPWKEIIDARNYLICNKKLDDEVKKRLVNSFPEELEFNHITVKSLEKIIINSPLSSIK